MPDIADLREFFGAANARPRFQRRPSGIPGDYRVAWRLSMLCLLVRRGRGDSLRLDHLHVLWWASRSRRTRELLVRWFAGERNPGELLVRFDPSLTVTLDLAVGHGLVESVVGGIVKLSPAGQAFADAVNAEPNALVEEKAFLAQLPSRITQREVTELLEWK